MFPFLKINLSRFARSDPKNKHLEMQIHYCSGSTGKYRFQWFSIDLGIDFGTLGHWFSSIWGGPGPRFWGLETMFNTIPNLCSFFPPLGFDFPRFWGPFGARFSIKNQSLFHLIFNTHFNIVFSSIWGGSGVDFGQIFRSFLKHFFKMRKPWKLTTVQGKCLIFQGLGGPISMIFLPFFEITFYITFFIDFSSIFGRSWGPFGPLGASFFDTFFDTIFRAQKNTKKQKKKLVLVREREARCNEESFEAFGGIC